jgi:hypothetical protein
MNRKLLKVIVGCIGMVLILGIIGIFIANYAVVKVLDMLSSESEVTTVATVQDEVRDTPPRQVKNMEDSSVPEPPNLETQDKAKVQEVENVQQNDRTKDNSSLPTGNVTKQRVKQVQESLTTVDKAKIISIMSKSLTRKNSEKLWDMSKGGLSIEEKQEAKELLLGMLTSDDYNALSTLAKKYGISKGKTYNEAKQELKLQP